MVRHSPAFTKNQFQHSPSTAAAPVSRALRQLTFEHPRAEHHRRLVDKLLLFFGKHSNAVQRMKKTFVILLALSMITARTSTAASSSAPVRLVTLDPGHFHAGLVQKSMYPQVDSTVYVYAPDSDDVLDHLKRVEAYNHRAENPTDWREMIYTGPDYFERMLRDKPGNVVVISGNNLRKAEYINKSIDAGFNVLADKPMATDSAGFEQLKTSFAAAHQKGVILYDIMTERSEITTILQREFSLRPDVFGKLQTGTAQSPAVIMESVHYYYKFVSGSALKRPAWFFDVTQQGEGMVDVGTHLVDLVQWECFPDQALDCTKDIQVTSARHWPTLLTAAEFNTVTGLSAFPDFLKSYVQDSVLSDYANGEINYAIKGVHAKVTEKWVYKAPEGSGDTHFSLLRGTKCTLVILQRAEQNYKPTLYIEPAAQTDRAAFAKALVAGLAQIQAKYSGVDLKELPGGSWQVVVPPKYDVGHEAHFSQVMERFLQYLAAGRLPDWEEPNMLAKYYTTTKALELARKNL
jgi:predicted dehydrogenase